MSAPYQLGMSVERVTDNVSVTGDTTVTRNDCPDCAKESTPGHTPCSWCDKCPGKMRRREDRRYCSSTCRHAAWQYRHSPAGVAEREAWETSDKKRQLVALGEVLRSINGDARPPVSLTPEELTALDVPGLRLEARYRMGMTSDDDARWKAARDTLHRLKVSAARTADVCGDCGARLYPSETVYRAPEQPTSSPEFRGIVYPSCLGCRCHNEHHAKHSKLCGECSWYAESWVRWDTGPLYCKAAGPDHGGPYCTTCHPKAWHPERPCEGCSRSVVNHKSVRPGYRREGGFILTLDYATPDTWRVFCSDRCRRSVFKAEQKLKRADRDPIDCGVCHERVDTRRRDSRYCSDACRQTAYRARRSA